ncbi:MAG: DNA primase [Candidatus Eisenbacteria bacterium]
MSRKSGGDDWVERVRAASDIVEVIGESVALRRAGRNWTGLCPFHKEKTPSFSVNAERQFFHCFGCKVGGDVFKFVEESEKVGFVEAVELLSRRAGIPIPERGMGERGQRGALLDALERAAAAYEQWLADPVTGATARAVLERRGVDRDTRLRFRLGVAPSGWENLVERLRSRVPEDVLLTAGLVRRRDNGRGVYDTFRDRLMVPLIANGGAVVGFGARALGDEPPKYLNSPETPVYHKGAFLFALDIARRHAGGDTELVLVEGYFDAITLHRAGLPNTVATSGTALTPEQARLLRRVTERVALVYDGDDAGREATLRSLPVLLAEGLEVAVVDLPDGDDPDTLVRRGGLEAWRERRDTALDPAAFVREHARRTAGVADPRERGLQHLVRIAAAIPDPIRARLLVERAAVVFGVPVSVVSRAVERRSTGAPARPVTAPVARTGAHDPGRAVERTLLAAQIMAPGTRDMTRERVSPEDFIDPLYRRLAAWLWESDEEWPDDPELAALTRELGASGGEQTDWAAEAEGAIRQLLVRRLRRDLQDRRNRLSHARDDDETHRIQTEIMELSRSLHELSVR